MQEALWLGVLREQGLQEITRLAYSSADPRNEYRSEGHNRIGLFRWEAEAIQKHFPQTGRLLIGGCGGGREAFALAHRGYRVVAFDSNAAMTAALRANLTAEEADRVEVIDGVPNHVPTLPGDKFDGAIIGWGAFSHITSAGSRSAFLKGLLPYLQPGAPILISYLAAPKESVSDRLRFALARFISAITFNRRAEHGDRIRLDFNPTFVHLFTRAQIEAIIAEHDLKPIHISDDGEAHCVAITSPR
jgi:SAM-dependent methyltransferase